MALHIVGMNGLGDCIYQRPYVRDAALRTDVWLTTPWPELYSDLPIRGFCKPCTGLRTQHKNMARQRYVAPHGERVGLTYSADDLKAGLPVSVALGLCLPPREPPVFDLPAVTCPLPHLPHPYAVVRPVTVRRDWYAPARNPHPEYMTEAVQILRESGYHVVSVADLEDGREWMEGSYASDVELHEGELGVGALMGLVRYASVTCGPIGWLLPMSMAYHVPHIAIQGGFAGANNKHALTGGLEERPVEWIGPERPCDCYAKAHECRKTIHDFGDRFRAALGVLC